MKLPKVARHSVEIEGPNGEWAIVKKTMKGSYCMRIRGKLQMRWGDKKQITEDMIYFKQYGVLPAAKDCGN